MGNDQRPDPDLLLKDLNLINQSTEKRGKLRVFLGMCPGVGKTFSMLKAAHERQSEGIDIVIGVVETHARAETEFLVKNLEVIPKKNIEYKNVFLEEMDIDAIIKRKPQIVLVDELAHTNVVGSRHPKRYLDVEELLGLGIDVYTTINIQHIETRSELVTQITGINIRETVPDSIISNAQQVELIDLNPDELIKRLNAGKVYMGDRAAKALDNFFKLEHLIALRELSLRFTAEIVDLHLRSEMTQKGILGPWNTNERLLVAISHSPYSQTLIRTTRRKAFNLEAPWIALYVNTNSNLSLEDQDQLNKNISLAKELGAEFIAVSDIDVVDAIKRIANQRNVSQIIMGRPDKRLTDIINGGTILERLTREASNIDIHVLRQERPTRYQFNFRGLFSTHSSLQHYYSAIWFLGFFSVINHYLLDFIGYRAVGFIYLFLVLIVASIAGRGPIIFTAILSAFIWDYFFIPPRFTFAITKKEDIMLCFTYLLVAIVTGYLAHQRKRQQDNLIKREEKANLLYQMTKKLSEASTILEIDKIAIQTFENLLPVKAYLFLIEDKLKNQISKKSISFHSKTLDEKEYALATWAVLNKERAGKSTPTLSQAKCLCIPLISNNIVYGVLLFEPISELKPDLLQEHTLETIISTVTLSIERIILSKEAEESKILRESEKLQQALLNSVSHELKTPLTALIGASTTLYENLMSKDGTENKLLTDIIDSSYRLNRVVENLLDMTRISSGHFKLTTEFFELKEFIQNIIIRNPKLANQCLLEIPNQDIILLGDTKLLEHAFLNILINALQYSPINSAIKIHVQENISEIIIKCVDNGKGISAGEEDKIFDRFYRAKNAIPGGTGLGLSIVKEVIEAHQGSIRAFNNPNGLGATFEIKLPFKVQG